MALADTLLGGAFGLLGGVMRNSAQAEASQDQINFQERMSNSAYQRAVADMRAAGLNPAMAYQQGGAGSPVGSLPQFENVATGASQAAMASAQVANIHADTENKTAQKELMEAQAQQARASAWQAYSQTGLIEKQVQEITNKLEMGWWQADADLKRMTMDKFSQDIQHSLVSQANVEEQTRQIQQSIKLLVEQTGTENARKILEQMKAKAYSALQDQVSNPYLVDKMIEWLDKGLDALNPFAKFGKVFKGAAK